jgi:DNA invertase Pin-like site-specific DNA recombinase
MTKRLRRVAIYERFSTAVQAEPSMAKTQTAALDDRLACEPDVQVVARYGDDGVSGTCALAERPDGARLMRDAEDRRFDELWVYRIDRLSRNIADITRTGAQLRELGIAVVSVTEGPLSELPT